MSKKILSSISIATSSPDGGGDMSDQSSRELGFELYLRNREMGQISDSLQNILLLPRGKRRAWIKENHSYLLDLVDDMTTDLGVVLDGMQLQGDTLGQAMECMRQLRDLVTTIKGIVKTSQIES